ncbi:MAG: hypothetical protein R3C11_08700 [Planctomycetaceae bacterium]
MCYACITFNHHMCFLTITVFSEELISEETGDSQPKIKVGLLTNADGAHLTAYYAIWQRKKVDCAG